MSRNFAFPASPRSLAGTLYCRIGQKWARPASPPSAASTSGSKSVSRRPSCSFGWGDFYETFDEDAHLVSPGLEIVLTSREMGKGHHVPMAGIPYHALDGYLARLINRGYKVAICEQLTPRERAGGAGRGAAGHAGHRRRARPAGQQRQQLPGQRESPTATGGLALRRHHHRRVRR